MGEGFKLRTMKMRGQLSQGLCMAVDELPELKYLDLEDGKDLTELLGVREWEAPERAGVSGTVKGGRPDYVPKTDETRIQSSPALLDEFRGLPYYITTKMDGSSHSVGIRDGEITYTTHNCTIVDDGKSSFINYLKENGIVDKLLAYYNENTLRSIVVQGEWCGPGIQKNRLKLGKPEWFVFTVMINGSRFGLPITEFVCEEIGAKMVPMEESGEDLLEKYPTIDALLKRAEEGVGYNGTTREGIVVRPFVPIHSNVLNAPLSMKVLNNNYLLKNEG
jgi:RNA ligase (TIGR02306 family)